MILLPTAIGATVFALIGYALSRILKRNDIADPLWGLGFITVLIAHLIALGPHVSLLGPREMLLMFFVCSWGLRLSIHLGRRLLKHPNEDQRYAKWRQEWGRREPWMAFLKVFALQGAALMIIALPIAYCVENPGNSLGVLSVLGAVLFLIGFAFEAAADRQLEVFKANPANRGRVLNTGAWSLCRHPNYFGEILMWWGFFAIAVNSPGGWISVASPLLITFLLVKVSGVPMLEEHLKKRGSEFEEYQKRTPALIPFLRPRFRSR